MKKQKDMTPEEQKSSLMMAGVPTASNSSRPSKFSQYSDYAQQMANSRGNNVPGPNSNPYASLPAANNSNPYTQQPPSNSNPYANTPSQSSNPYAQQPGNNSNPYAQPSPSASSSSYVQNNRIAPPDSHRGSPAPTYRSTDDGYSAQNSSPYATAHSDYDKRYNGLKPQQSVDTLQQKNELFGNAPQKQANLNLPNRAALFGAATGDAAGGSGAGQALPPTTEDDELMMTHEELEKVQQPSANRYTQNRYTSGSAGGSGADSGPSTGGIYGSDEEVDSEEEDVERIRQQVRYIKKDTVNETRNALQAAARAEESGRNALGMLGAQGERIANTERTLALAETQNKIASEKARELKTLNRSMFAVHVKNPFTANRKLLEKEDRIKTERQMEQLNSEQRRKMAYDSQQRVSNSLLSHTETAQKYASQRYQSERSKYTVGDGDSEDEDMENEIDRNLDELSLAAKRLNKLALSANEEINVQNDRLREISEQTDRLDVGVHLNTNRLRDIR